MLKKLKLKFINLLVRHLYKWDDTSDVFIVSGNNFIVNGVVLKKADVVELKNQAELVKNLEVYKLIRQEFQKAAQKQIFENSKNLDDILFGKVMLYMLDVIDKRIEFLSKL
jgi:hypothetical protein